jgi:hypothetical protein
MDSSSSDRRQALENLSIIRETISRSTGSTYFVDFFRQAGLLLLVFGLLTVAASAATHAILAGMVRVGAPTAAIVVVWIAALSVVGLVKVVYAGRRARSLRMSLVGYSRAMLTRGFFHAVIPVAMGAIALVLYFAKEGQFACVPALMTLYAGAVLAAFGTVYLERRFAYAGHALAALGAVGLLLMTRHVLLYLTLVGGLAAIHGLYLTLSARHAAAPSAGVSGAGGDPE